MTAETDDLQRQVRELAETMVRLDRFAEDAHEANNVTSRDRYRARRELTQERRSGLLRELWDAERTR